MKLKPSKVLYFLILLCVLLNVYIGYFFGIVLKSPFLMTITIMLFMCVILLVTKPKGDYINIVRRISPFLAVYILGLFVEYIYSMAQYSQSISEVWDCVKPFLYLFLVFPIVYVLLKENNDILLVISIIVCIVVFLRLIQAFLYNTFSIVLFRSLMENAVRGIRNNRVRMDVTCLGPISTIYLFYYSICRKPKIVYYFLLGTNIVAYIYMYQSRVAFAAIISVMIIMFLCKEKRGKRELLIGALGVALLYVMLGTTVLGRFIGTFADNSEIGGLSTKARILSIDYYFHCPYRTPLLGMGFINDSDPARFLILHRTQYSMGAYYSDLGVLGLYFNLGILGLALYSFFFFKLLSAVREARLRDRTREKVFVYGIFAYYCLSSISLLLLTSSNIFTIPFIWAYVEIYTNKLRYLCVSS